MNLFLFVLSLLATGLSCCLTFEDCTTYYTHLEYVPVKVTWNDALEGCKERGSYLVQLTTLAKYHVVNRIWKSLQGKTGGMSIGMSFESDVADPYWTQNCEPFVLPADIWLARTLNESKYCGRLTRKGRLSKSDCSFNRYHMCEKIAAGVPCPYRTILNVTITDVPSVYIGKYVGSNETQCQNWCSTLLSPQHSECWAFRYTPEYEECLLYYTDNPLLLADETNWRNVSCGELHLRECFHATTFQGVPVTSLFPSEYPIEYCPASSHTTAWSDVNSVLYNSSQWLFSESSALNQLPCPDINITISTPDLPVTSTETTSNEKITTGLTGLTTALTAKGETTRTTSPVTKTTTAADSITERPTQTLTATSEEIAQITIAPLTVITQSTAASTAGESASTTEIIATKADLQTTSVTLTTKEALVSTETNKVAPTTVTASSKIESIFTNFHLVTVFDRTTNTTADQSTAPGDCICRCHQVTPTTDYVQIDISHLNVNKKQLSSSRRKLESATDDRVVSVCLGYGGIAFLVVFFILLMFIDGFSFLYKSARDKCWNRKQRRP